MRRSRALLRGHACSGPAARRSIGSPPSSRLPALAPSRAHRRRRAGAQRAGRSLSSCPRRVGRRCSSTASSTFMPRSRTRLLIVDYKSDPLEGQDPAAIVERGYTTQRLVYALAGLRAGAERVDVVYSSASRRRRSRSRRRSPGRPRAELEAALTGRWPPGSSAATSSPPTPPIASSAPPARAAPLCARGAPT